MQKLWQDPQLRILLVMNIIALGAILTYLIIRISMLLVDTQKKRELEDRDSRKLKRFVERLKDKGVPEEISNAFEELYEEMVILEESTEDKVNTFFALVQGLEKKIDLLQNSTSITEKKMIMVLQSIVSKLKKANRKRVDRHADNLFKRLNRLETEEIKGLEERLVEVESFMEAMQMFDESPESVDAEDEK